MLEQTGAALYEYITSVLLKVSLTAQVFVFMYFITWLKSNLITLMSTL